MGNKPVVHFYEKPGCINNTRQKQLLREAGLALQVHNLLTTNWQAEELMRYLQGKPLAACFNPTSPAIKSGQIKPDALNQQQMIAAMQQDPLLIRRPLIRIGNSCLQGFDWPLLQQLLGLETGVNAPEDIERCPQQAAG